MPKSSFIIIEKSYLIRKGLISLIDKIPNTQTIQQIDQTDDLKALKKFDADFVIINSNLIHKELIKTLMEASDTFQLILLSEDNDSVPGLSWVEKIDLNESHNSILKKLNNAVGNKINSQAKTSTPDEISDREADILRNIALGYSNKEIADKLFISTHTVVTHRKNITRKLGIKTVPGLTIYAILNKLINIDDQSKL